MSDLSPILGRLEAAADFLIQARQLALDSQTAENACCCRRVRQNIIPVFRLPNEILSGTFLLYKAAMYAEQASCTHGRPDPLTWIRISHVCQHWRSVALSTPQLWTDFHVVGQDPQFVMEMLALSKRMSVTVKAELYKGRNPQPIQTLLAEIHRVESLELELAPPVNRLLESAAPSVAPRLRCLTLCSTDKDSLTVTPMPTVFNDCEFPVLQELTVSGYRLQWSSNILAPTLTRLKVTCWGRYAAPVAAILQALALMPLLENLDLSGCVTPFPLAEQEALLSMAIKPVTLGRLTQLCMTTTSIFMTTLLDSLIIPATCKISLCLRSSSIVGNTSLEPLSNAILSKLSGKTTIGSTTPFRTLVICKEPPTTVVVALWRDVLPVNGLNEQHPDLPPPDLRISIMLYPVSVDDVLHMCGLLPLWDIEVLSIAPGQMEEKTSWPIFLPMVPKLTTARIIGSSTTIDLHRMLKSWRKRDIPVSTSGGRAMEYFVPHLRVLVLDTIQFREACEPDDDVLLTEMLGALNDRRDGGLGLEKLVLENCVNMGANDVQQLRGLVDVAWDGVECFEEDMESLVPVHAFQQNVIGAGNLTTVDPSRQSAAAVQDTNSRKRRRISPSYCLF